MKVCFNRTYNDIFEKMSGQEDFYNSFFDEYNINLENSTYIHLYEYSGDNKYITKTIFVCNDRVVVWDAILEGSNFVPYTPFTVNVYKKNNIKALKISNNNQWNPTYEVKIVFDNAEIDFVATEHSRKNADCKKVIKFLNSLFDTKE